MKLTMPPSNESQKKSIHRKKRCEINLIWVGDKPFFPGRQRSNLRKIKKANPDADVIIWTDMKSTLYFQRDRWEKKGYIIKPVEELRSPENEPIFKMIDCFRKVKMWACMSDILRLLILTREEDCGAYYRFYTEPDNAHADAPFTQYKEFDFIINELVELDSLEKHHIAALEQYGFFFGFDSEEDKIAPDFLAVANNKKGHEFAKLTSLFLCHFFRNTQVTEILQDVFFKSPKNISRWDVIAYTGQLLRKSVEYQLRRMGTHESNSENQSERPFGISRLFTADSWAKDLPYFNESNETTREREDCYKACYSQSYHQATMTMDGLGGQIIQEAIQCIRRFSNKRFQQSTIMDSDFSDQKTMLINLEKVKKTQPHVFKDRMQALPWDDRIDLLYIANRMSTPFFNKLLEIFCIENNNAMLSDFLRTLIPFIDEASLNSSLKYFLDTSPFSLTKLHYMYQELWSEKFNAFQPIAQAMIVSSLGKLRHRKQDDFVSVRIEHSYDILAKYSDCFDALFKIALDSRRNGGHVVDVNIMYVLARLQYFKTIDPEALIDASERQVKLLLEHEKEVARPNLPLPSFHNGHGLFCGGVRALNQTDQKLWASACTVRDALPDDAPSGSGLNF